MAWFLESGPPEPVMKELTFRSDSPYFCETTTERTVSVDRHERKHFWSPSGGHGLLILYRNSIKYASNQHFPTSFWFNFPFHSMRWNGKKDQENTIVVLLMFWILKRLQKLCVWLLTFRIGSVLPAAGAGRHHGLVLGGFVGFGGHHELLTSQTRGGWSTAVLQGFIKLNCWEKGIQWDDRENPEKTSVSENTTHTVWPVCLLFNRMCHLKNPLLYHRSKVSSALQGCIILICWFTAPETFLIINHF